MSKWKITWFSKWGKSRLSTKFSMCAGSQVVYLFSKSSYKSESIPNHSLSLFKSLDLKYFSSWNSSKCHLYLFFCLRFDFCSWKYSEELNFDITANSSSVNATIRALRGLFESKACSPNPSPSPSTAFSTKTFMLYGFFIILISRCGFFNWSVIYFACSSFILMMLFPSLLKINDLK